MASSTRTKSRARRTSTKNKGKSVTATPAVTDPSVQGADLLQGVSLTFTRQDIEVRAYEIWRRKGCPVGQDAENWHQAEQELTAEALDNR